MVDMKSQKIVGNENLGLEYASTQKGGEREPQDANEASYMMITFKNSLKFMNGF